MSGQQAGVLHKLGTAARALRRAVQSVPELRLLDVEARQNNKEGGEWTSPVVVVGLAPVSWICESCAPPTNIPMSKRNSPVRTNNQISPAVISYSPLRSAVAAARIRGPGYCSQHQSNTTYQHTVLTYGL